MRQIILFFGGVAILLTGCDPGLTIRQVEIARAGPENHQVTIHIKTNHQFIGDTKYVPEVKVTNSSRAPITVTKVELVEPKANYENKLNSLGSYPVPVSPGDTKVLDVWFDLNDSVKTIFQAPIELRVHYRLGDKDEIARATIVGGRLDTSSP